MKLYDVLQKENTKTFQEREKERFVPHELPPRHHFVLTKKKLILFFLVGLFLVSLYAIGIQFVHAKVFITQRRISFTLSNAAIELTNQEIADSSRLSFQAMVVRTTITRQVYGSALTTSNTKAKGSVVFFNEWSTSKQTVKKGTTLTASNGKKYVTQEQVIVPGYTVVNKKKTPGTSPSVGIVALDVGESYNSTGTTFSVSGWTNAAKTFYARSTSISGGEAGVSHTLTEEEKEEAIQTLQAQLIERLKRETRAQIPADLVTFPELQFPIIDTDSFVFKGGSVSFPASMSGSMVSYLIPREMLEQAIAAEALSDRSYAKVSVPDLGDLSFDLASLVPTNPTIAPESITVAVSGSGTIIPNVPIDKVKEQLLGKPRRTFETSLNNLPEIETARFRLAPFWSPRFPSKWSKIDVVTK